LLKYVLFIFPEYVHFILASDIDDIRPDYINIIHCKHIIGFVQARRRLLLTGTPLQNNLIELMSLLVFLMPDLFVDKTDILKRIFTSFGVRKFACTGIMYYAYFLISLF